MRSRALNDLRLSGLRLTRPIPENLPAILLEAIAGCLLFVTDRGRFPELGGGRGQPRYRFTESGRERDLRRLEACALVLQAILLHTDLVRMRSGRTRRDGSCDSIPNRRRRALPGRGELRGRDQATLETETGLSGGRVDTALRDLRAAGYITTKQPISRYETDAGVRRYMAWPAIHTVTELGWERLGVALERLSIERALASRREREEPAPLLDVLAVRARQRVIREEQRAFRAEWSATKVHQRAVEQEVREERQAQLERIFGRPKE